MNNNDKIKKSVIESIVVVSFMALYIIYGIYFLPLLVVFIPLPFIVLGKRNGISSNIISLSLTSIIIGFLLGVSSAITLFLIFAPFSFAINYCLKNRKTTLETVLIGTLAFFISLLILMYLGGQSSDYGFAMESEQEFKRILAVQVENLKESGMTNYQILESISLLESAYNYLMVIIPSFLIIFSLIVTYINYFFTSVILRKMGYGIMHSQGFSKFKLPSNIILGTGVMFLFAFIIGKLEIQYHEALLYNLIFLVAAMFYIQGLSVFDFLLIRIKIKLGFRILLIAINIIFIPMSMILFFIGILDSFFDLRKIRKQKS